MNVKLLICDDEKIIREGLASLDWNTRGIEVVGTAKNGEVAFELFQKMLPDIVISDIKMPTKDGIWLSEQIHKISPNTKIIFLTGYNDFEYAQSAINNGVCQYLLKPIDEFELYKIVDKLTKEIHLEQQKAEKEIARINKLRSNHYEYYTERGWETPSNYDICVNSDSIGIDNVVDLICSIVEKSKELAIK